MHITPAFAACGLALGLPLLHAQDATPATSVSAKLRQFNYGPDGRVNGLLLQSNTLVYVSPEWSARIETAIHPGDLIEATGSASQMTSAFRVLLPVRITAAGQSLAILEPTRPALYTATGVVKQYNFGSQGEINGFLLDNGVLAHSANFTRSSAAVIKPGATVGVSGFSTVTPFGKTLVELQYVTVNGQVISMAPETSDSPPQKLEPRSQDHP